jgi:hypothetical protein
MEGFCCNKNNGVQNKKKRKIFNVCGEETLKHFNGFIVLNQNLQISKVQL